MLPSPFLCIKILRYPKFSEIPKGSPTIFFGSVRQKNFDGKSWHPQYREKFSIPEQIWNKRATPTNFFGTERQKTSDVKTWYPRPIHTLSPYHKFSETQNGSPKMFFDTVKRKISAGKSWYSLPLLFPIFSSHTGKFLNSRRLPPRRFLPLWHWKFATENPDTAIIWKSFRYQNFSETQKGSPTKFSALWD